MTDLQTGKQTGKRTAPRDVRRKQLIMAAIDSISKLGFSGTTLKHVTEKANLSHGVVNYHFDSKEALYDATLGFIAKEHYEMWMGFMQKAGPEPAEKLRAVIEADFDKKICAPKKMAVWFAFWGQAKYRPNYLKIHARYDEERFTEIGRLCSEIIREGNYSHLDPNRTARTIEALIDGLWLTMMLYPSDAKRLQCRDDCFGTIALLFPDHVKDFAPSHPVTCKKS
ncbi:MAG: TetR family transcriptional regulator C-terminal domain-containing protein [Pseudomonadota bacterium]